MSSTKATTTPKDETEFKRCECGCGVIVNPKRHFAPGHDQRHKGVLLRKFDGGDTAAAVELTERGWRSEAELAKRRATAEKREQAKKTEAQAKVERNRTAKEKAKTAAEEVREGVAKPKRAPSVRARGDQPAQPIA
jgi:hypothetical protein